MLNLGKSFSFLVIGKTQESKEVQEFKKYVGVGSSYVVAVSPTTEELTKIYGREMAAPDYVVDGENGKEARIHFIVKTDPEQCGGVEIINRLMFTLRNAPAYNRDQTKVQVIDQYGNSTWASVEDAKAGKKLLSAEGKELKIDEKYRMACVGEADLVSFLKVYLVVGDAFKYQNGSWIKKPDAADCVFGLEKIKNYFNGDFSELKEALKLQPNNKVKLLYGVRTSQDENGNPKEYQAIAARQGLILHNNAGKAALDKMQRDLDKAKAAGAYPTTVFEVHDLAEYNISATNLETPATDTQADDDLPW